MIGDSEVAVAVGWIKPWTVKGFLNLNNILRKWSLDFVVISVNEISHFYLDPDTDGKV